jgi:PAS domain S-box-containing protein
MDYRPVLRRLLRWLGELALVAFLYLALSLLSFKVAILSDNVTIFWPVSGFAVAAVLLIGRRAGLGIWVGALVAYYWIVSPASPAPTAWLIAAGLAVIAALQALFIVIWANSWLGSYPDSPTAAHLGRFATIAAICTLLASICGILSLAAAHVIVTGIDLYVFATWWLGDLLGVILFTPVVVTIVTALRRKNVQHQLGPTIVGLGVMLSLLLFIIFWKQETNRIAVEFSRDAQAAATEIQQAFDMRTRDLDALDGLLALSQPIDYDTIARFVPLHQHNSALSGKVDAIAWVPQVTAAQRTEFERSMSAEGFTDYALHELTSDKQPRPVGKRAAYFPIQYMEPLQPELLGVDLAADPAMAAGLAKARDAGRPVVFGPVDLAGVGGSGVTLFDFHPVYDPGKPQDSFATRRESLLGYIAGAFQIGDVIASALAPLPVVGRDIYVFDEAAPLGKHLLYVSPSRARSTPPVVDPGLTPASLQTDIFDTARIMVDGQPLLLVIKPAPGYVAAHRTLAPWLAVAVAIALTGFLTIFMVKRHQSEVELRESQRHFQMLAENVTDVIWVLDVETQRFRYVSPSVERLRGLTPAEVLAGSMAEALAPESIAYLAQMMPQRMAAYARKDRSTYQDEIVQFDREGRRVYTETSTRYLRNENTGRLEVYGVSRDIGERKRSEAALRASREELARAQALAHVGSYTWNLVTNEMTWSDELRAIIGRLDGVPTHAWADNAVHPDDYECVAASRRQAFETGALDCIYRIVRTDGAVRWVHDRAQLLRSSEGDVIAGAMQDITERQRAEEAQHASEERYRQLVENSHDLIDALDPGGRYVFANRAWLRTLEYTAEELPTLSLRDIVHPDAWAEAQAALALLLEGRAMEHVQTTLLTKNGRRIEVEGVSEPQLVDGKVVAINTFLRNVTEERQAEQIQAAQFAVSRILAFSPEPEIAVSQLLIALATELGWQVAEFWRIDAAGTGIHLDCSWWSPADPVLEEFALAGKALTLRPHEGLAGQVWTEGQSLWVLNLAATLQNPRAEAAEAAGLRTAVAVPVLIGDAIAGVMDFFATAAHPQDLQLLAALSGIGRQVGQFVARKEAEAQLHLERALLAQRVQERTADLSRANAQLGFALRAKDEFLANMSHELRTPLTAILALSESMQEQIRGPLNPGQMRSMQLIEQSGHHLLDLISDVLDVAKVEAGKLELEYQMVDVAHVCQASMALVQEMAVKKQLQLTFSTTDSLAEIYADSRRLKQILVNLLTNAVKFTPNGGRVSLTVEADPIAERMTFSVRDTGIGIAVADISRLFQPFTQLDSGLARHYEGTGLGLALVRRLVDLHGGSVSVESDGISGRGSCFTVALPWQPLTQGPDAPAAVAAAVSGSVAVGAFAAASGSTLAREGTGQRILLAEDNEINLDTLASYLTQIGYHVLQVRNGQEAVAEAQATTPDLVLMDIQMPVMDGLEAIRQLRKTPVTAATPIVAFTALAMPGDSERCRAAGADVYMAKPVSLRELRQIVAQLINHRG